MVVVAAKTTVVTATVDGGAPPCCSRRRRCRGNLGEMGMCVTKNSSGREKLSLPMLDRACCGGGGCRVCGERRKE
jgi:hypothetical protein